ALALPTGKLIEFGNEDVDVEICRCVRQSDSRQVYLGAVEHDGINVNVALVQQFRQIEVDEHALCTQHLVALRVGDGKASEFKAVEPQQTKVFDSRREA